MTRVVNKNGEALKKKLYLPLKGQKAFKKIRKKGFLIKKSFVFIVYCKNETAYTRVAWVFGKWAGSAVQRNRWKRWGRALLSSYPPLPAKGLDLLFGFNRRGKNFYKTLKYETFYKNFKSALKEVSL